MVIKCSQCGFTRDRSDILIGKKQYSTDRIIKKASRLLSIGVTVFTLTITGCSKQSDVSLFGFQFHKAATTEFVESIRKDSEAQVDDKGILSMPHEFRYLLALPIEANESSIKETLSKYNNDELSALFDSGWKVKVWLNSKDSYKLFRVKGRIKMADGKSTVAKFNEIREALGIRYGVPNRTLTKGDRKFCLWMAEGVNIVLTGNFKGYTSLQVIGFVNEDTENRQGLVEVFGEEVFAGQNGGAR